MNNGNINFRFVYLGFRILLYFMGYFNLIKFYGMEFEKFWFILWNFFLLRVFGRKCLMKREIGMNNISLKFYL